MKVETRGRPRLNLTDEERAERRREASRRSRESQDTVNLSIDGTLLNDFKLAKDLQSEAWGIELTNKQFFKLMISEYCDVKSWDLKSDGENNENSI